MSEWAVSEFRYGFREDGSSWWVEQLGHASASASVEQAAHDCLYDHPHRCCCGVVSRRLVEDITGVTDLSTKTDLSCNVYAQVGTSRLLT